MKHTTRPPRTDAPDVIRRCKRCGVKRAFVCGGRFRVNAQKRHLDVWLIYRCSVCGATWNHTVFTRVSPQSLPPELLEGFHRNDPELALRYAVRSSAHPRTGKP